MSNAPANPKKRARLTIRPVERGDASEVAELMEELGYPTRVSEMEMRLDTIKKQAHYRAFVAISSGKVCGMIGTCCLYSYEHNNMGGRILALVVSERMRGRGVGKALLQVAENDLVARNVRRVALNTRFEREEAH